MHSHQRKRTEPRGQNRLVSTKCYWCESTLKEKERERDHVLSVTHPPIAQQGGLLRQLCPNLLHQNSWREREREVRRIFSGPVHMGENVLFSLNAFKENLRKDGPVAETHQAVETL